MKRGKRERRGTGAAGTQAARRNWGRAGARDPQAWRRHAELAQAHYQAGRMAEAFEEWDKALELRGPDASLYALRARARLQFRAYEKALEDADRALALAPKDASLHEERAEILAALGRLGEARKALEAARRLAPDDPGLRVAELRALLADNKPALAAKRARELALTRGPARADGAYYEGCARLKAGQAEAAARCFEKAFAGLDDSDPRAMRARFYWSIARVKEAARRAPPARKTAVPRLYICGLGLFAPYTATLEVVHALGRCDVLVNNVGGPETRDFLTLFCPRVIAADYSDQGDAPVWIDRIFEELGQGRSVAFVTRGHPMMFGDLGSRLARRAAERGVPCESFAAVSSIDALLARTGLAMGVDFQGVQAYERGAIELGARLEPRTPLLVYFYSPMTRPPAELQRSLRAYYPPDQRCWMFGPQYEGPVKETALKDLARAFPSIDASRILFLPPAV